MNRQIACFSALISISVFFLVFTGVSYAEPGPQIAQDQSTLIFSFVPEGSTDFSTMWGPQHLEKRKEQYTSNTWWEKTLVSSGASDVPDICRDGFSQPTGVFTDSKGPATKENARLNRHGDSGPYWLYRTCYRIPTTLFVEQRIREALPRYFGDVLRGDAAGFREVVDDVVDERTQRLLDRIEALETRLAQYESSR